MVHTWLLKYYIMELEICSVMDCQSATDVIVGWLFQIIVWHVKTERPDISREDKNPSDPSIEL